jgi:dinuclear metal center YbgI/SA1388 family protein
MKLREVVTAIESVAPLALQEKYDNAGLLCGHPDTDIRAVLVCLDVTGEVISEALETGANLIISHHPVVFSPLKKFTGATLPERILVSAIRHDIALYAAHTNLDNYGDGVNRRISEKLGLINCRILQPLEGGLRKLVTFVPTSHAEQVRSALFEAGAGKIGDYNQCSYNVEGTGSFRASENCHPFTGEIGEYHLEAETRIETVFPVAYLPGVVKALLQAHPYEEVAYDIYPIENHSPLAGAGMVGELPEDMEEIPFLHTVKSIFSCHTIRHSALLNKPVKRIALCGGSGSFLLDRAVAAGADIFLTADIKYHQFFEAAGKIVMADIGHYESEQFTIEIICDLLKKKFPNFAVHFSRINTNSITYL